MKDIIVNGEEYELDVNKAVASGALVKKYKLDQSLILPGSIWKSSTHRTVLIARVKDKYAILCFDNMTQCRTFQQDVLEELMSFEKVVDYLSSHKYRYSSIIKVV